MVAVSRYAAASSLLMLFLLIGCDHNQPLAPDAAEASLAANAGNQKGPSNLTVTASPGELGLGWLDNSPNETAFGVLRSSTGANGAFATIATTPANVTLYSDTGLDPALEYCYKVQALALKRIIGVSSIVCATPLRLQPNAASNLDAFLNDVSTVRVTWTDNSFNEDGFYVARGPSKDGPFTKIATLGAGRTAFVDGSPIANHEEVCYEVVAFNKAGGADPSNIDCTAFLFAPTKLTAVTVDGQTIDLQWLDNSSFEDGYELLRYRVDGSVVLVTLPANATRYRDAGLAANTQYVYFVRGKKDQGYSAESNAFSASTVVTAPPAPTSVLASPSSSSSDSVTWTVSIAIEDGFRIERSTDGQASWTAVAVTGPGENYVEDAERAAEEEVCYRVIALNGFGESGSSPVACTAPSLAPTDGFATTVDQQTIDLTWIDNSGVETGYVVGYFYFDDYSWMWLFQDVAQLAANSTTYRLTGFSTDLTYAVAATRDGGHSDFAGFGVLTGIAASAPRATALARPDRVVRPHKTTQRPRSAVAPRR